MRDIDLLVFGCAVFFAVIAGIYVAARESFVYSRLEGRRKRRSDQKPQSPAGAVPAESQNGS